MASRKAGDMGPSRQLQAIALGDGSHPAELPKLAALSDKGVLMRTMVCQQRDDALQDAMLQRIGYGAGRSPYAESPPLRSPEAAGDTEHPESGLLMQVLDAVDYGVLLVNAHGRVYYANQAARRSFLPPSGWVLTDGHVRPGYPRDRSAFEAALRDCARGRRVLLVAGESLGRDLALVPLQAMNPEASILLLTGKDSDCPPLTLTSFARAHGLTAAEASVLGHLCGGHRPEDVAHRAGVATSTVRTQINSIRAKTATASVGHLMRRIMSLPPIMPLLQTKVRDGATW